VSTRKPSRLITGLAGFAIVAGLMTPSVSAMADDEQTPVDDSATSAEAVTPTPAEEEAAEAAVPEADGRTIHLAGTITRLADEHAGVDYANASTQLFRISGHGFLAIDVSGLDLSAAPAGILDLEFAVPAGVDLGETAESRYAALRAYTLDVAPLKAIGFADTASAGRVAALVNQTPASTAVHQIYAVLVTPADVAGTSAAANQTIAKVQATVAHANSLWSDQSNGIITFALSGTTSHYKSAYNCEVGVSAEQDIYNSDHIWAEAAAVATTQLGYKDGPNRHLVLFFPSASDCGAAAGLAALGSSVNTGGPAWVVGTDGTYEKATLAHELGHSLSYGHANWADCSATNPQPGRYATSGCLEREYGDAVDVMGGGVGVGSGGSLSSPSAIRSGIWPSSAYTYAPSSTTTSFTLNAVSSHTGLRSVIVEDNTGDNYFVEFRNQTGRDAQYNSVACPWASSASVCNSLTGVRILRQEQSYYDLSGAAGNVKGRAGDATILIGHKVGATKKGSFTAGETFSTNGVTIAVTAVTATTATVSITRPATALASGAVRISRSSYYDGTMRAGDVLTALIGATWEANSYSYQWLRNGKVISGATKSTYTLNASDVGKAIKIKLTGKVGSKSATATDPASYYSGYGPIAKGVMSQGTVSINASTPVLTAVPANWTTPSVTFKYQWLRNGAKISGATKSTFSPTATDSGKSLSVTVTASKSGFSSKSATSAAKNYTVLVTGGAAAITGAAKVGATLTATSSLTFATQVPSAAIASPVRTYQWYRSGTAISGATASTYVATSSDYAKTLTVKVSGSTPGYASAGALSPASAKVVKGTIAGSLSAATVTKSVPSGILLTASLGAGVVTEPGVSLSYQWYRGTSAISKATKSTYAPTSSDYGKLLNVKITVKKSNYDTAVIASTPVNYSVTPSTVTPVIANAGGAAVGTTLTLAARTYTNGGVAAYQWLRDGKTITGATAASYLLGAGDKGKAISVKVSAAAAGFLTSTSTSAATQKVNTSAQSAWNVAPSMVKTAATITFTAAPGVTEPGVKVSYQWYRGTTAISKATKSTYKVTSASYGKDIKVRVTTTKTGYTTVVAYSTPQSVSVMPVSKPKPTIDDTTPIIGQTLAASLPTYSQSINPPVYQWYASGKAIAGATSSTFTVQNAQKGKTISVKVVASATGFLTSTLTSAATSKVIAS
jgi:hypothetical protein